MTMESLLRYLIEKKGSDLHLMAGLPPAIRVNGKLQPIEGAAPFTPETIMQLVYSVLAQEQIKAYEESANARYELDFAYSVNQLGRFRFNVHKQRGTVAAVARAIATKIPSLESLNLPAAVLQFTEVTKGLALVTGPTGSGKSTTLASIIDRINSTRSEHILTIEDPIEYIHNSKKSYVTQREVGLEADTLSFRNALKYALRQDPDIILVGEMRDYDTIGIALTSAETGHLVFGTLHTPSCPQTIGRIIDVFPSDAQPQVITQLGSNLVGVLAQILLPKIDRSGRVAAVEIMKATPAIKNLIRSNNIDGLYQSIQTGSKDGMQTMDSAILALVRSGQVAVEEALPHTRDEVTRRQIEQLRGSSAGSESVGAAPAAPNAPASVEEAAPRRGGLMGAIPPWEQKQRAAG